MSFIMFAQSGTLQRYVHGTSVAIVRDDDQIVIAADSRATNENHTVLPDICKIRAVGDWYVSTIGVTDGPGLDVYSTVSQLLIGSKSLATTIEIISETLTPKLNAILKSNDKARDLIASLRNNVVGIIIFGHENGVVKLSYLLFRLDDGSVSHKIFACPTDCSPEGRAFVFVPVSDGDKFDWSLPISVGVPSFVQMEIDRHTIDIGPPIQILRVDRFSSHWVEKPDVCKDER
jgi:hypothetical protein